MRMKATEAVRKIMEDKGVTLTELAGRSGKKVNVIWDRLSQKNISVEKLNEMARVLDYKIIMVPRETRMSEGYYEVE